jgi:hypothetical protein
MKTRYNSWLIFGATLSSIAALLHVAIIFGGGPWYRFFGAGEEMALASEAGNIYPTAVTAFIAIVLALWAAYALSGAGVFPRLPLLKWGLIVITAVYLLRGLAIVPLFFFAPEQATSFLVWSSIICIVYGAAHFVGTSQVWGRL